MGVAPEALVGVLRGYVDASGHQLRSEKINLARQGRQIAKDKAGETFDLLGLVADADELGDENVTFVFDL